MGNTWGDIPPSKTFENPEWHNNDLHTIWQPPPRCITCGGHRVSSIKGRRPIQTRHLGFWAWLAELPMRWLARSLLKKDSRLWSMEEATPHPNTATDLHHFPQHVDD